MAATHDPPISSDVHVPTSAQVGCIDRWAARALQSGVVSFGLAGLAGLLLAGWLPHYLTWPWWSDSEAFAFCAQNWSRGVQPYRDIAAGSFPGQIYVFYVLGSLFGWGRTAPFYALDAALVLLLGFGLVVWSRRVLGWAVPGLLSFLAFLWFYLGVDFSQAAQRDWQAACFVVLSLLCLQAWPGRPAAWVASALLMGLATAFRPHVIFFLPAVLLALDETSRAEGGAWSRTVRAGVAWSLLFGLAVVLAFLPLILAGLFDDFLNGFAFAASYRPPVPEGGGVLPSRLGFVGFGNIAPKEFAGLVALLILTLDGRALGSRRRLVLTWLAACAGAVPYKAVHPVFHEYLNQPSHLTLAVSFGLAAHFLLREVRAPAVGVLALLLALTAMAVPTRPAFWSPSEAIYAFRSLLRPTADELPPEPRTFAVRMGRRPSRDIVWGDYFKLLAYLRKTTTPETQIATLLTEGVAVHGAIGRDSAFRTESGVFWALALAEWQHKLADQLAATPDAVVVTKEPLPAWCPPLRKVVLEQFEPEAHFGELAVWRRKGARTPLPTASDAPPSHPQDAPTP